MLNHITLMGRLTRDPELRYTQSQTPVASFTLAVDRDFGSRDGGEKQTDFIDCVAWRQSAEFVSKYFQKGSMAVVSGRLQIRDWTDREGGKRRSARSWLTMCTSARAAAVTAAIPAATAAAPMATKTAAAAPAPHPPRLPPLRSWMTATASCRSKKIDIGGYRFGFR